MILIHEGDRRGCEYLLIDFRWQADMSRSFWDTHQNSTLIVSPKETRFLVVSAHWSLLRGFLCATSSESFYGLEKLDKVLR